MSSQRAPDACTVVIFGASGDLTARKLMPSLFRLWCEGVLPDDVVIAGAGRNPMTHDAFRELMLRAVEEHGGAAGEAWNAFAQRLRYVVAGAEHDAEPLRAMLGERNRLFYLAIPPSAYAPTVAWLGDAGLAGATGGWSRIVVEKPFGRDRASADALNAELYQVFAEPQIFRIDHYLGKETVQNLFVFRFANGIFEPVWNRRYVDNVQITVAESLGVEDRASYYEEAGAVRDMVQNHLLQLLALTAMEPPVEFAADAIRDEKVKVLHAIEHGGLERVVRGRYAAGSIGGTPVPGYLDEAGVAKGSTAETFIALEAYVDNWRWAGVPWYLRTGKRLPKRITEIAVHFKQAPFLPFAKTAVRSLQPNVLALRIQPNEGIELCFGAKSPDEMVVRNVAMHFDYEETFGVAPPEAYKRLLLDAMLGDATLFTRADEVRLQWEIVSGWLDCPDEPYEYPAGSWGPHEAATLAAPRTWRRF